jgi:hypothetical protein
MSSFESGPVNMAEDARDEFFEFVLKYGSDPECTHLQDYIYIWLRMWHGATSPVFTTFGDYGMWMHTVALIIAAWADDLTVLKDENDDVIHVDGVYDPTRYSVMCFDPLCYQQVVFKVLHQPSGQA